MAAKSILFHVQVRAAGRFADYYPKAKTWEAACEEARKSFKSELPKGAKHLADWATFSC